MILVIMVAQFNSIALPLIVISSVLMSVMGVIMGLIVHDRPFGIIMTGVGTVALAGIVVNNAIVMLDYVIKLRKKGYQRNEAMILAAAVRFRPCGSYCSHNSAWTCSDCSWYGYRFLKRFKNIVWSCKCQFLEINGISY